MAKSDKLAKQARARERARRTEEARAREAAGLEPLVGGKPRVLKPKAQYERRQSGLEQLRNRNKVTLRELRAGQRYGDLFRAAHIEGDARLQSALASLDQARGSGGGGKLTELADAEVRIRIREEFQAVQMDALRGQVTLIAACDVICGKEWTPQQITPDRGAQLQIETSLRIALDMLADFFWPTKGPGQTATDLVAA